MRGLALLLLLANIIFLWWQLSWLPSWLPWQPSDFTNKDVPSMGQPVSDLPKLVLWHESHSINGVASVSTNGKINHETNNQLNWMDIPSGKAQGVKESDSNITMADGKELLTKKMTSAPHDNEVKSVVGQHKPSKNSQFEDNNDSHRQPDDTHQNRQNFDNIDLVRNMGKLPDGSTKGSMEARTIETPSSPPSMGSKNGGGTRTMINLPGPPPLDTLENTSKLKNSPLAEEIKAVPVTAQPSIKIAQAPTKKASSVSVTCFKAGPYTSPVEAKKVADWLKSEGDATVEMKNQETPVSTKTWVYLPSLGSRQAAHLVVQRLFQQGIKDVTDQAIDSNNAISLGVFKNKDNATRRVKELQAKGYNEVKTEEHHENETTYWLTVKMAEYSQSVPDEFRKRFNGRPVLEAGTCE